jgi:predicted ATPase/DNA-binding XRE family transcriptional regulator
MRDRAKEQGRWDPLRRAEAIARGLLPTPSDLLRGNEPAAAGTTKTFGELLREYRLRAGKTQEELGAGAGLSARTISDLERGVHKAPFRYSVAALVRALSLTPAEASMIDASIARGRRVAAPGMPAVTARRFPLPLTPIIGRDHDVDLCTDLLLRRSVKLLTLTGLGGVGKTRLALELGYTLNHDYHRNVTFVCLESAETEADVLSAIAENLGLADPDVDGIARQLRGRETVVVFDNFDNVIAAGRTLMSLLEFCPGLQAVVTSREPLCVRGEQIFLVEPLAWTPAPRAFPVDAGEASPAVRMFVGFAQARNPGFELTPANAPVVHEIVARLDGLPLAIELAAARTAVLSPREILDGLRRGANITGEDHLNIPMRHRSVREAICWSFAALPRSQQELLRYCSQLPSVWSQDDLAGFLRAEAPASVSRGSLDLLEQLVSNGFVQRTEIGDGVSRFRMLRLVKEYVLAYRMPAGWKPRRGLEERRRSRAAQYATVQRDARP